MSSAVQLTSSQDSHDESSNERLDLIRQMDPTAGNLSLSDEIFLKAAVSLKNQVRV